MLQGYDLTLGDFEGLEGCNEVLNVTRPDVVGAIHTAYLDAGADCIETNTFGANLAALAEYDASERITELAGAGARIARAAADAASTDGRQRYVLGSVGPGTKLPSLGHISYARLRDAYQLQAEAMIAGGVDGFQVETCQDLLQAKAAVNGARRARTALGSDLPIFVNVTIETAGTMLLGSEIGAALTALEPLDIDAIGLNCGTGPTDIADALPAASILSVGSSYSPNGVVDLNGTSQTVSQLKRGTTGAGSRIVTSAAPATLTVSGSTASMYDGLLTGALSLVKAGTSILTLSGTNTYSGATLVSNGTLLLSAGSSLRGSLDVTVAGGTLSVQSSTDGLADTATLRVADGGAKVSVQAGVVETVGVLYLGGKRKPCSTYGATGSGAAHIDSAHFSGTGVIKVLHGPETIILVK